MRIMDEQSLNQEEEDKIFPKKKNRVWFEFYLYVFIYVIFCTFRKETERSNRAKLL